MSYNVFSGTLNPTQSTINHSKSQPTDDKSSLKWVWACHVIQFKFQGSQSYLWNN